MADWQCFCTTLNKPDARDCWVCGLRNPAIPRAEEAPAPAPAPVVVDDKPLILVNFTKLSNGAIHNKFDPNACNDPEAKSALARKISADYARYAADAELIASGDVRASGTSCWRAALAELRVSRPGQFFAPVFPP